MNIRLPSAVFLNSLTAKIVTKKISEKSNVELTFSQAKKIVRAIRDAKKRFPDWVLVEIDEKDGEHVEIRL